MLAPLISASVIAGLLEVLRIYLGYEGNLREKVRNRNRNQVHKELEFVCLFVCSCGLVRVSCVSNLKV